MRRRKDRAGVDDESAPPSVSLPGFEEWDRRHAETKRTAQSVDRDSAIVVSPGATAARRETEFQSRHGRRSRL